jgi:hypothetical protein
VRSTRLELATVAVSVPGAEGGVLSSAVGVVVVVVGGGGGVVVVGGVELGGGVVVDAPVDVVPVDVVLVVVDVVVVVVVAGGVESGTRTSALKFLRIVSGRPARSKSWIRPARTVIRHSVPPASVTRGVNVKLTAGETLRANTRGRPGGQASLNDAVLARTRSLKRTDSSPRVDIDTDTTRGRTSADDEAVTSRVSHDVPSAADTLTNSPTGAATATASTFHQRARKAGPSLTTPSRIEPCGDNARGCRSDPIRSACKSGTQTGNTGWHGSCRARVPTRTRDRREESWRDRVDPG